MKNQPDAISQEEPVAAISTPVGEGGIGVVRMSGQGVVDILRKTFCAPSGRPAKKFQSHHVRYGFIIDGAGQKIDEALVTVMLSPRTYTREDVVEISCHGGVAPARKILERLIELGARMAEPGEFTKRAFINGRIDLLKAEAIIDLIRSKSEKGWQTAFSQLDGRLSMRLERIEETLVGILSQIETSIDFPDEELEIADDTQIAQSLQTLKDGIARLSDTYIVGRIYRNGVGVAIVGKPNVGKSSLMNALLEKDRVIVTPHPGATRDTVEETLQIEGVAVRIIDTAGLRDTDDPVEKIGVERAMATADTAEIILLILDGSEPSGEDDEELLNAMAQRVDTGHCRVIPVVNKSDLGLKIDMRSAQARLGGAQAVVISAKTGAGIDALRKRISTEVEMLGGATNYDGPVLTRQRHKEKLREMLDSVGRAITTLARGLSREFVAADLRSAKSALEELTGRAVDEQVIEKIFSEFCIGK